MTTFRNSVKSKLFSVKEEYKVFKVKLSCKSSTTDNDRIVQEFSIQSANAEGAKNSALALAKDIGYFDCEVEDISMVVDPLDPRSANLGIMQSLGAS